MDAFLFFTKLKKYKKKVNETLERKFGSKKLLVKTCIFPSWPKPCLAFMVSSFLSHFGSLRSW